MTVAMIVFGVLTVIAACGVVCSKSPLNSALSLVVTLFLVAGHFAILGAHFMAAMQILVYAGAIMVLVVFVIMLLGLEGHEDGAGRRRFANVLAGIVSGLFFAMIFLAVSGGVELPIAGLEREAVSLPESFGTTESIGQAMFTTFVYPFEIIGLLLLAAIIGAVLLAHEKRRPLAEGRGLRAVQRKEYE